MDLVLEQARCPASMVSRFYLQSIPSLLVGWTMTLFSLFFFWAGFTLHGDWGHS